MKTGYPIFSVQESAVVCSEKDLKIGTLNLFFFKNFLNKFLLVKILTAVYGFPGNLSLSEI